MPGTSRRFVPLCAEAGETRNAPANGPESQNKSHGGFEPRATFLSDFSDIDVTSKGLFCGLLELVTAILI